MAHQHSRPRSIPPTQKRTRNQFKAWLIHELNKRGSQLDHDSPYTLIMKETQRSLRDVRS